MKKFAAFLVALLVAGVLSIGPTVPLTFAQTLSDQVLLLLSRANTWTADQTFTNVTITGVCTGCGGAGGGTVTSVDFSVTDTAIFTASGGPIVGSGTLNLALDAQADNTMLAGPASGGPLVPTFRVLVDSDVPDTITISGTNNVTWTSVDKTGSSLADLATRSASDLSSGTLALARLTDGVTNGVPLLAGGGGGDPSYSPLDLTNAAALTGQLAAANFPILTGDITTAGGTLVTDLSDTGVTAATYGTSAAVGQFTVDAEGRITAASNVTIATAALLSTTYCADCAADAPTRGSIIIGNASNLWDELVVGTSGQFLRSDGTDIAWGTDGSALTALNAANVSTGTLALARGGSGASLTATNGGIVYSTASAMAISAAGTPGQCLTSNGAAAPTWGACATLAAHNLLSTTHGDTVAAAALRGAVIIGNATPAWTRLTIGASGTFLRSDGTDVSWGSDGANLTNLNAGNIATGTLLAVRGGTGQTSFAVGDILYANTTTTLARLASVVVGQTLISNGAGVAPSWSATPTLTDMTLTGAARVGGSSRLLWSATAPTISSGFGTSPSISANNGTAAFRIDVGTGGTATQGVIGLPTAATGWNCWVQNITSAAANNGRKTLVRASTTTTVTVENQQSTGAAIAWAASSVLQVSCFAY